MVDRAIYSRTLVAAPRARVFYYFILRTRTKAAGQVESRDPALPLL